MSVFDMFLAGIHLINIYNEIYSYVIAVLSFWAFYGLSFLNMITAQGISFLISDIGGFPLFVNSRSFATIWLQH